MDNTEPLRTMANWVWVRCQIYGVLPGRRIRIHLAGLIDTTSLGTTPENPPSITFAPGFLVADEDRYRQFWTEWPVGVPFRLAGSIDSLRIHPIGPTRLALVAPGDETIVCVLFRQDDDGRQEEVFPGFTLGPIDLDQIARTITTDPTTSPEQTTGDTIA